MDLLITYLGRDIVGVIKLYVEGDRPLYLKWINHIWNIMIGLSIDKDIEKRYNLVYIKSQILDIFVKYFHSTWGEFKEDIMMRFDPLQSYEDTLSNIVKEIFKLFIHPFGVQFQDGLYNDLEMDLISPLRENIEEDIGKEQWHTFKLLKEGDIDGVKFLLKDKDLLYKPDPILGVLPLFYLLYSPMLSRPLRMLEYFFNNISDDDLRIIANNRMGPSGKLPLTYFLNRISYFCQDQGPLIIRLLNLTEELNTQDRFNQCPLLAAGKLFGSWLIEKDGYGNTCHGMKDVVYQMIDRTWDLNVKDNVGKCFLHDLELMEGHSYAALFRYIDKESKKGRHKGPFNFNARDNRGTTITNSLLSLGHAEDFIVINSLIQANDFNL